jgi:hypothetical protein
MSSSSADQLLYLARGCHTLPVDVLYNDVHDKTKLGGVITISNAMFSVS